MQKKYTIKAPELSKHYTENAQKKTIDLKTRLQNPYFIIAIACFLIMVLQNLGVSFNFLEQINENISKIISESTKLIASLGVLAGIFTDHSTKKIFK